MPITIDVRRADDRFHTDIGWLDSRHSFSFSNHYDPTNVGHGLLIVSNDDRVAPGGGFGTHSHQDMEIVTWVLDGALEHRDSAGNHGVIRPGEAQLMSAGTGIAHSEMNHSASEPVHFVQMWVVPDTTGLRPGYDQVDVGDLLVGGELVTVASGRPDEPGAVHINQRGASMRVARLDSGRGVTLSDAAFVHLFVARGAVTVEGAGELAAGDAARFTAPGPVTVTGTQDAEIIVWDTDTATRR
jgi:redox-sensitive bicupin YhaK (pirin superfamily)